MSVTKQQAAALYAAVFNRAPDQEGLNYWIEQESFNVMAESFVAHPVFTEQYGDLDNQAFVEAIYENVLLGQGDAEGIEFWVGALDAGLSRGEFLASFIDASLNYDGDDAEALLRKDALVNKVTVGLYYTDTFGEATNFPADADIGSADIVNSPVYQKAAAAIENVTADPETVEAAKAEIDREVEGNEPDSLTEALAKLAAADEKVAESEEALVKVLVDADILASADGFDPKELETYTAEAEASVQTATAVLAEARAKKSDAALQQEIAQAQAAINANKPTDDANAATVRYDAQGELLDVLYAKDGKFVAKDTTGATVAGYLVHGESAPATDGTVEVKDFTDFESTVFTARQLQSRADSAKAAVDANIAAKGETLDLATQLNAELGKALGAGTLTPSVEIDNALKAYGAYKTTEANADATPVGKATAMKSWWDAMSKVVGNNVVAGTDGEPRYVLNWDKDSPLAKNAVLKELIETFVARGNLEFTAAEREIAFKGGNDVTDVLWNGQIQEPSSPVGVGLKEVENAWNTREDLIDAFNEAKANQEALNEAITTYSDDVAAFEALADELGYVIQTVDSGIYFGTDEDDLFLFNFETLKEDSVSAVTINDLSDTDVLYFGPGFVEGVKGQEDNNTLEFFITEVNGNAVLQVENTPFGSQTDDFVEITLTGVSAADVSFEDGAFFLA